MKLLAYTSPARGNIYPTVPILATLTARGHAVRALTLSSELGHLEPLGIDSRALDETVERNEVEDWRERSLRRSTLSVIATFLERAGAEALDAARAIEDFDPDVLLIDINCWGAATAAEASGRPWAIYAPYLLPLPSREVPPFGLGLAPMRGPLGRARDALVRAVATRTFDGAAMPALNELRARHGLPALARFGELLERPPLLLSLTAEGFEYPRSDWPANVRLVGPIQWAPPAQTPAWLTELGGGRDDDDDPLVLVTCSTERQADARLLEVALRALPAAGMRVLATSAAHDPAAFDAPAGSKVVRFIPHDAVLERAACVVCHGGMGITQKALAAGVPVVVVPFGRDQLETARRVQVAEAGARVSPRRLTPRRLTDAVQTALGCRAGAQRVRRAFAAAGGAKAAADAIEVLDRGEPGTRHA